MVGNSISYNLSYVKTKSCKRGFYMARIIDGDKTNIVGEMVRYYRKQRKMSQRQLSVKLELMGVYVCRGSISRIEDSSRTVTDIELFAIAKALGVSINDLFSKFSNDIDLVQ